MNDWYSVDVMDAAISRRSMCSVALFVCQERAVGPGGSWIPLLKGVVAMS